MPSISVEFNNKTAAYIQGNLTTTRCTHSLAVLWKTGENSHVLGPKNGLNLVK